MADEALGAPAVCPADHGGATAAGSDHDLPISSGQKQRQTTKDQLADRCYLAPRQGKIAGHGLSGGRGGRVCSHAEKVRPISAPGGDRHAHQRRPRPHLPPLRLQRHPPPPDRRPLSTPSHRQHPRNLGLRRRCPRPSALGDAVRQHRLPHNPASPPVLHRPPSPERRIWTAEEAARFLTHCHQTDPEMADLFEVLIGTGMRKGEALGLHWDDVHLAQGVPYIRCTLSAVDNNRLVFTTPKTRSSRGWVAISPRVATALRHRARSAPSLRGDPFAGLVFCQPDGRPLGPHLVLDRLHRLSEEARVPRVTVHYLRHLAATITITAGVPLTVVSKTLRHSTLSTTANLYSHLTQQAAHQAVDTIDHVLSGAQQPAVRTDRPVRLRPPRDHIHRPRAALHKLRSPAPPATSTQANQPRSRRAITLRPPRPGTHEKPPSHG
nr:site-specific integrase [Streptomyces sp. or43]